ncbi:hypothetical protein NE237_002277 [Protea cynaroides]|uniref:Uncharacterized protein n=1 Tax=Protea cynaroides TaxID=273540 RepID=A0A9Q0KUY4_9MAGN|nr:hypothetical protein NE237_002277 [Protea cynaroides]
MTPFKRKRGERKIEMLNGNGDLRSTTVDLKLGDDVVQSVVKSAVNFEFRCLFPYTWHDGELLGPVAELVVDLKVGLVVGLTPDRTARLNSEPVCMQLSD